MLRSILPSLSIPVTKQKEKLIFNNGMFLTTNVQTCLPVCVGCAIKRAWFDSVLFRFLLCPAELTKEVSSLAGGVPSIGFFSWRVAELELLLNGEKSGRPRSTIVISITIAIMVGGFWMALRRSQHGRSRRSCQSSTCQLYNLFNNQYMNISLAV